MRYIFVAMIFCAIGCDDAVFVEPFVPSASYVDLAERHLPGDDAPTPDSTKCPNCNGKGWTGDSVTKLTCNVCGGSGLITRPGDMPSDCPCGPTCTCDAPCQCGQSELIWQEP